MYWSELQWACLVSRWGRWLIWRQRERPWSQRAICRLDISRHEPAYFIVFRNKWKMWFHRSCILADCSHGTKDTLFADGDELNWGAAASSADSVVVVIVWFRHGSWKMRARHEWKLLFTNAYSATIAIRCERALFKEENILRLSRMQSMCDELQWKIVMSCKSRL